MHFKQSWFLFLIIIPFLCDAGTLAAPDKLFNPLVKNVRVERTVLLECNVVYEPGSVSSNVRWLKKGLEKPALTIYGQRDELVHDEFAGRLKILNGANLDLRKVRRSDAGYYTCQVELIFGEKAVNSTWKDTCHIFLNVLEPPIILNHSARRLSREPGQTVTLFCSVRGNPRPSVRWFQGEVSVPRRLDRNSARVRVLGDSKSQLVISQLQHSDAGVYTCQASNTEGSVNAKITLTVKGGVYITDRPKNKTAMELADLDLPCKASGDPNSITYLWLKDGRELSLFPFLQHRYSVNRDGTLQLTSVQRLDDGWYTCIPTNNVANIRPVRPGSEEDYDVEEMGIPTRKLYRPRVRIRIPVIDEVNPKLAARITTALSQAGTDVYATAYLKVLYKPQTSVPHNAIYLAVNRPGELPCDISANPPEISVQWQKAGTSFFLKPPDNSGQTHLQLSKKGWTFYKHVWKSVSYNDAGLYRCQGYSVLGWGKWSDYIQVIVKEMPYFTLIPEPIYQNTTGGSLFIPCQAYGDPKPTMLWYRSDGNLVQHVRYLIGPRGLTIENLSTSDQNLQLHCVASNPLARLVTSTRIYVLRTSPEPPKNVTVTTALFSAQLSWKPGFDGGAKQTYTIYYRLASEIKWTTIRVLPDSATHCELLGLLPDEEYVFSVVAINVIGKGLFSRPVTSRTLGFSEGLSGGYLSQLPRDSYGVVYFPNLVKKIGPAPLPPQGLDVNITSSAELFLSWRPASQTNNSASLLPPVLYYRVEYSSSEQNGPLATRWHQLAPVLVPVLNLTLPRLPNGRLVAGLRFRVRAYALLSVSLPSDSIKIPSTILATLLEARSSSEWWSTIIWLSLGFIVVAALMLGTFFVIRRTWHPVPLPAEVDVETDQDKFDDQCSTFSRTLHKSGLSSLLRRTASYSHVHPRSSLLTLVTCCGSRTSTSSRHPEDEQTSTHLNCCSSAAVHCQQPRKQVSFAPDLLLTGYINGMYDIELDPAPPPPPDLSFQRFDSIDYPSSLLQPNFRNWSFERAVSTGRGGPATSSPLNSAGAPAPRLQLSSEVSSVTVPSGTPTTTLSSNGSASGHLRRRKSASPISVVGRRQHERTGSDPAAVVTRLNVVVRSPESGLGMETRELARWLRCEALKAQFGVASDASSAGRTESSTEYV